MISQRVFMEGMGLLAGAYGREVDAAVSVLYFDVLSPALDDAQFIAAVKHVVATERFWPSPAVVRDAALGSPSSHADAALEQLRQLVLTSAVETYLPAAGTRYGLPPEVRATLDAATLAGLRAAGGVTRLHSAAPEDWPRIAKLFRDAHIAAATAPDGVRLAAPAHDRITSGRPA